MGREQHGQYSWLEACVGTHHSLQTEHLNTRWVIGAVHDGEGELKALGCSMALRSGGIVIVPPGVSSQTYWSRPSRVSTIFCWPEHFDADLSDVGRLEIRPGVGEDSVLSRQIAALATACSQTSLTKLDGCYLAFLEALAETTTKATMRPLPLAPKAIRRVRDFLHAEFTQKISLDQIADIAGLSRYHVHKAFRASVGVPPHTYLTQLRLERARALLSRGWLVAEVAVEVGFYDQSHFSRSFRKHFGTTPSHFAQQS